MCGEGCRGGVQRVLFPLQKDQKQANIKLNSIKVTKKIKGKKYTKFKIVISFQGPWKGMELGKSYEGLQNEYKLDNDRRYLWFFLSVKTRYTNTVRLYYICNVSKIFLNRGNLNSSILKRSVEKTNLF